MVLKSLTKSPSNANAGDDPLEALRATTQRLLVMLAIFHVPLIAGAAAVLGADAVGLGALAAAFAAVAVAALKFGGPMVGRAVLLASLQCQVATLLAAFSGHPWQVDIHMYFFAIMGAGIVLVDIGALVAAAAAVAVHHLALNFAAATLVYPGGSDFFRTVMHAVILIFETAALIFAVVIIQRLFKKTASSVSEANERTEEARAAKERAAQVEAEEKFKRDQMLEDLESVFGEVVTSAQNGHLQHRITRQFDEPQFQRLASATNDLIAAVEQSVQSASKAMGEFSKGNLTARMEGQYGGKFAELQNSIRSSGEQLSQIIIDIRGVSESVARSATEITSRGQQGIAQADEQSRQIGDATASMASLAELIAESAEKTAAGERLATQTKNSASEGAQIVKDAVEAMQNISDGSRQIEEIVGVIDSIAFQTNLLALNAAVEAARAGDAGKGFTVVANEVRQLAKRAGDSSREIRELIATSVKQVAQGVQYVDRTGQALDEIAGSVEAITRHAETLHEITSRKSSLVDGMTRQMSGINDVTTRTADLAKTNGKRGETLHDESTRFLRMLEQFDVAERAIIGSKRSAA